MPVVTFAGFIVAKDKPLAASAVEQAVFERVGRATHRIRHHPPCQFRDRAIFIMTLSMKGTTRPTPTAYIVIGRTTSPSTGRICLAGRVGVVFRQGRVHVVPGLGAFDEDVGLGAEAARIVERADAN